MKTTFKLTGLSKPASFTCETDKGTIFWAKDESNKRRVDEIFKENTPLTPESVRKAMKQYGKEQYEEGYTHASKAVQNRYDLILDDYQIIIKDRVRLKELVKAQKELIEMHKGEPPHMLHDGKRYSELINQIKELES